MTVDFKPIANGGTANVISQAQYLIDLGASGSLEDGFVAGTAQSDQVNKVVRQSAIMSAALAEFIAAQLAEDVLDDGVLATLLDKLTRAIKQSAFTTGDLKMTMKTAADVGWVMMNDGTIGSGASGAAYANNNAEALFTLLWNNVADAWCPVVTGRGGSAAADWAANKRMTLPKALGRALAVSGAGAGLTARALGTNLGEETHVLLENEMPAHQHTDGPDAAPGVPAGVYGVEPNNGSGSNALFNAGSGASHLVSYVKGEDDPHNNMQPTVFLNVMIKL